MTFCFPNPDTIKVINWFQFLILIKSRTFNLIVPALFRVPSMFLTGRGRLRGVNSSPSSQVKFWSMNFPPAPQLIRVGIPMILDSSFCTIGKVIGTVIDCCSTFPNSTL